MLDPDALAAATGKKLRWSHDGAVTCALLAAECALKATLLHGKSANSIAELPGEVKEDLFQSAEGHSVRRLWDRQESRIKALDVKGEIFKAVDSLNGRDRYLHRYGAQRPDHATAEPVIKLSNDIVVWMRDVLTK